MRSRSTVAAVSLLVVCGSAHAGIVSTAGRYTQIAPPPSLAPGQLASTRVGYAIDERQNVLFTGLVDRLGPNLHTPYTHNNAATAFLSTWVSSHIIHAEANGPNLVGTVSFDAPIIALIYINTRLDASDATLGNIPTTVYPQGVGNRGFSVATVGLDTVRLLNSNTVHLTLGAGIDQIRVLTVGVPAPGPIAALAMGGLLATGRRR